MARLAVFSLALGCASGSSSAGDASDPAVWSCPDLASESEEAHEVLLLQVDSTVRLRSERTGAAVTAFDGGAVSAASVRAAVAQVPEYSSVLVTEEMLPTLDAIIGNELEGNVGPERCHRELPQGDDARPFEDVLAENPDVTGWCHYGGMGTWLSTCAAALEAESFVSLCVQYGAGTVRGSLIENEIAEEHTPHSIFGYQGEHYFTDYRYLAWDSLYCLDNGFLDQSRYSVEAVHDFAHMTELQQEVCDELLEEFPDMRRYAMSDLMQHAGQMQTYHDMGAALPVGLRTIDRPSPWNNRRHAAWKCVLGSLGCDISNCAYNYCLRDTPTGLGTFIGHGRQCREGWMPREDIQEYVDTIGNGADIP